jgi:hypothetical protein
MDPLPAPAGSSDANFISLSSTYHTPPVAGYGQDAFSRNMTDFIQDGERQE